MFELHTQLVKDCRLVGDLLLSQVLLRDDSRFPWLILVPRHAGLVELFDLSALDQRILMEEMSGVAAALASHTRADKMNVATLGNVVPQLHIHVIARRHDDAAWPDPVWGRGTAVGYTEAAAAATLAQLGELLQPLGLEAA
jgi:diadenosine tetraphosphate (Ap4A) HIT family hydrolase